MDKKSIYGIKILMGWIVDNYYFLYIKLMSLIDDI